MTSMTERSDDDSPGESGERTLWLLITALCVGGAERTLVDLANGVDPGEYDVTVWSIFSETPLAADLDEHVTVRSLTDCGRVENGSVVGANNPLAYVTVPIRFCYAAWVERPAIIQSFLIFDNLLARLAGVVCPATIITGVRSVPNDRSTVREGLDRLTIGLSDVVVSNSGAGAEYATTLGADPESVTVVRNGRDVERFRSADPTAVRAELDVDDDELVVGTVGRLLERKGCFELVTAWEDVQQSVPNARLVFVGDGQDRERLEAHAAATGCADSVTFLGNRRDVPELLAAMDLFAFPSHFEGLPGAVIEAMAAGLPIVATPVDGTAELLDAFRSALFVPVDDPDQLAWAITRALESPTLRRNLGAAAQTDAEGSFTIDAMVGEFETLYGAVLDVEERPETRAATPG